MTIGINLLREAREKFAAAVAAVKDELKNPDTVSEVAPAVSELGNQFNEHLKDLGSALDESSPIDSVNQDDSEPVDKGESEPNSTEPEAPASTEHHESLGERIKEELTEALDSAGNAIGEAKFGE